MQVTVLLLLTERGATLLEKDTFHPLNYIMKEEYSGSMEGMRYMLKRSRSGEEDIIRVTIWPEPFNLLRTPDDLKDTLDVPLTAEGVDQARLWINEQYESRRDHWLESLRRSWIE